MVMGGLGEEHSVMKLVLGQNNWYSVPPMSFPRVQVRIKKKTMRLRLKNKLASQSYHLWDITKK